MNVERFFISNSEEFTKLGNELDSIFNRKNQFPNQVFSDSYAGYKFEEFNYVLSDEVWNTLQRLAIATNDDFVYVAVLDPSPDEYYYKEFGYYNWIKLPINLTADQYFNMLDFGPKESPVDAILFNSYTVVWFSPSLKWGIWGERNIEVCVIGFIDETVESKLTSILNTWRPLNEVVSSWIQLNFSRNETAYEKLIRDLKKNYSINK